MLRIRLFRKGKKNQPFFRIVVVDRRSPPKGGNIIEMVGSYNPVTKERKIKGDRVKYWISVGAQPSDVVHNFLVSDGIIEGKKISVHSFRKSGKEKSGAQKDREQDVKKPDTGVQNTEKPKERKQQAQEQAQEKQEKVEKKNADAKGKNEETQKEKEGTKKQDKKEEGGEKKKQGIEGLEKEGENKEEKKGDKKA